MDIAEFLLARIAEDEAAARAATTGPWVPDSQGWTDAQGASFIQAPYHELDISDEDAGHITRWQPDRVLAECEAKRRRVKALSDRAPHPNAVPLLRKLLALEAVPFADHPDYDPAWSPLAATPGG